jgi:hypothetical protein
MERRNFLKGLCTLPAIGILPSLGYADTQTGDKVEVIGLNRIV